MHYGTAVNAERTFLMNLAPINHRRSTYVGIGLNHNYMENGLICHKLTSVGFLMRMNSFLSAGADCGFF